MTLPTASGCGIGCHAGLVADCRCLISYSQHDPASSLGFWIPAFAGMTTCANGGKLNHNRIKIRRTESVEDFRVHHGTGVPFIHEVGDIPDHLYPSTQIKVKHIGRKFLFEVIGHSSLEGMVRFCGFRWKAG